MSIKTLKKLETAGENKKARHKAGLPTGAQFISNVCLLDEKRCHADAETQVPLGSAKACAAKFCGRMGKGGGSIQKAPPKRGFLNGAQSIPTW